jgi:CheY-like chemotaxis protein
VSFLIDDIEVLLWSELLECDPKVFLVYDAHEAFQLAEHFGFSVALIDLDLKGKDGLITIQNLRMNFPDLPVVVISTVLGVQ